jgi:hypothetical protein
VVTVPAAWAEAQAMLRRSVRDRQCFVCRLPIGTAESVAHGELGIVTHTGACAERVDVARRVYDRSRRGRWRRKRDVLRQLRGGGREQ